MQMNLQVNPAERLRELGIRPSPQRLAVYSYLLSHPVHPTADTIYQAIITAQPSLSRTTIYNTLKLLVHKKAVSTVIIEDGELRFDADLRPHAHFKCRICGRVYDLFNLPEQEKPAQLSPSFKIEETHICYRGTCGCR